jgi:sugar lactone lactonase YvrE
VLVRVAVAAIVMTTMASSFLASSAAASSREIALPTRIELPDGFRPEGIAIKGTSFYVGSLADGSIYRGDVRTGEGAVIGGGATGAVSVGLAVDRAGRVFAAGGATGDARVIDGRTGEVIKTYELATATPTFINDVVIARGSAWFTDSNQPVLYRVPLDLGPAETIPISGELVYTPGFNVNGIEATANGKTLVLVQTSTGSLFTSDLDGVTKKIDLGGELVDFGDGLLLEGRMLYVVQNQANQVAVIKLDRALTNGTVLTRLANEDFDVPTTIDRFGRRLYAVNARFNTPPGPTTKYWVTAFDAGPGPGRHFDRWAGHRDDQ